MAVLSFGYGHRRFAADPSIVNQSIEVNAHPFTQVGVAPAEFRSVVAGETPEIFLRGI